MLNEKEKKIINEYIHPILSKWEYSLFLYGDERTAKEVHDEARSEFNEIKDWIDAIITEKFVKYTSAGIVRRYTKKFEGKING